MNMIVPVVLSGGVGSRLWPVSREMLPKQFIPLVHAQSSMLQETIARFHGLEDMAKPLMVCNEAHRFLVAEQLRDKNLSADILLEPVGRNTAPAIALAALYALDKHENPCLLVLPADHDIALIDAFHKAVEVGLPLAKKGKLVTFGVVPNKPETGYGYIQQGSACADKAFDIARFVEKPDAQTAQAYIDSGEYLWNSGMFLLSAQTYIDELQRLQPEMMQHCREAYVQAESDLDFIRIGEAAFSSAASESIDYAVMEHTSEGVVVPLDCGWSDVGSWSTLWDINDKDSAGNVTSGDAVLHNVSNSYIRSDSRLVAALGIDDAVIVETPDAVLVASKDHVQDIKHIVGALNLKQRKETTFHTVVYRPWGSYESLVETERFQVKRIVVNPGQKLSLQMHYHRAEHWVVVKGTAEVVCGEKTLLLGEDESTYIPLGHKHRLANPGVIPLEIIEVQTGSYLGEDDIVRFEDVYGRGE
jgi:mannose-1-phosphate guanylyltransferase/mannose-6-phosphate isomerase